MEDLWLADREVSLSVGAAPQSLESTVEEMQRIGCMRLESMRFPLTNNPTLRLRKQRLITICQDGMAVMKSTCVSTPPMGFNFMEPYETLKVQTFIFLRIWRKPRQG